MIADYINYIMPGARGRSRTTSTRRSADRAR